MIRMENMLKTLALLVSYAASCLSRKSDGLRLLLVGVETITMKLVSFQDKDYFLLTPELRGFRILRPVAVNLPQVLYVGRSNPSGTQISSSVDC